MKFSEVSSLLKQHKVNTKKVEQSQQAYRYQFQNFFQKDVIVPSIHIGEASRDGGRNRNTDLSEAPKAVNHTFPPRPAAFPTNQKN